MMMTFIDFGKPVMWQNLSSSFCEAINQSTQLVLKKHLNWNKNEWEENQWETSSN